jgi:predicted transcriptional regulator
MVPSDRRPRRQRAGKDPVARELGAAQAEVLNVLWSRRDGATVAELHAELNRRRARRRTPRLAYTTVLTFVQRLRGRGFLSREPEGRGHRYRATMGRDELLASWSDELIERLLSDYGDVALARLDERLRGLRPRSPRCSPCGGSRAAGLDVCSERCSMCAYNMRA